MTGLLCWLLGHRWQRIPGAAAVVLEVRDDCSSTREVEFRPNLCDRCGAAEYRSDDTAARGLLVDIEVRR